MTGMVMGEGTDMVLNGQNDGCGVCRQESLKGKAFFNFFRQKPLAPSGPGAHQKNKKYSILIPP
jgi:hypothetical protein